MWAFGFTWSIHNARKRKTGISNRRMRMTSPTGLLPAITESQPRVGLESTRGSTDLRLYCVMLTVARKTPMGGKRLSMVLIHSGIVVDVKTSEICPNMK